MTFTTFDKSQTPQLLPLFNYRRPNLVYSSSTVVSVETGLDGTSGDAVIMFPDGNVRTETSSTRYNMTISQNAVFNNATLGSNIGGLRTGSVSVNTWYACYAVKVSTFSANWVLVADTVLPIQANYSTLNTNFGTNSWVYLGIIRNGNGLSGSNIILEFYQSGNHTIFNNAYTSPGNGFTFSGISMAFNASSATSLTVSYVGGTGATNIPNNISMLYWIGGVGGLAATSSWNLRDATNNTVHYASPGNTSVGQANSVLLPATKGSNLVTSTATQLDLGVIGFIDGVLGIGSNPLL